MIIDKKDINKIIPQQAPFAMIDQLIEHTGTIAKTQLNIAESNILVEDDFFSQAGMIENMAQTAAAHLGYAAYLNGLDAPVGFIAAIKNLKIIDKAKVGSTINTKIEYLNTILNIHIVQANIFLNDLEIAKAELRIFIQE